MPDGEGSLFYDMMLNGSWVWKVKSTVKGNLHDSLIHLQKNYHTIKVSNWSLPTTPKCRLGYIPTWAKAFKHNIGGRGGVDRYFIGCTITSQKLAVVSDIWIHLLTRHSQSLGEWAEISVRRQILISRAILKAYDRRIYLGAFYSNLLTAKQ